MEELPELAALQQSGEGSGGGGDDDILLSGHVDYFLIN